MESKRAKYEEAESRPVVIRGRVVGEKGETVINVYKVQLRRMKAQRSKAQHGDYR